MITYAQNFEDVLLARLFKHKPDGFYIDVGAHDPDSLSVTKHFYGLGWHGINIEPVPANFARFPEQRPRDINLNVAAGAAPGTLTLHVISGQTPYVADGSALSTFHGEIAVAAAAIMGGHPIRKIEVPVQTLAAICAESCPDATIDFLKIDVEGWEKQVLLGADFKHFRPRVILIEATKPDAVFHGFDKLAEMAGWDEWEELILAADYRFGYFDGLNRFYIRAEDAAEMLPMLAIPVGLYDGFQISNHMQVADHLKDGMAVTNAQCQDICRHIVDAPSVVDKLRNDLAAREKDIDACTTRVETLQNDITGLLARLAIEQQRADALTSDNLELTRLVAESNASISRITQNQDELQAGFGTFIRQLSAIESRLAEELQAGLGTFTRQLSAIECRLAEEMKAGLGTFTGQLSAVEQQLAEMRAAQARDRQAQAMTGAPQPAHCGITGQNTTETPAAPPPSRAATGEDLPLLRAMARESAFRQRHKLRLALLRWVPFLPLLRWRLNDADLGITAAANRRSQAAEKAPAAETKTSAPAGQAQAPAAGPQPEQPRRRPSKLKISVITPSFNSGSAIEQAILSVMEQGYAKVEHLVIDGGSTDGTIAILKRYPHLKWISEPDKGQADAMNKGFARASGDIIVYLNADDTFLPGAFNAVIPAFEAGAMVVMGRVRVVQEKDGLVWENDPRTDLTGMLRHWERDAFCVNPVGYFYRREVQKRIPFNLANDDKMDLEFLLGVAANFEIVKVDATLGIFNYARSCKTGRQQCRPDYWQPANFPFVNRFARKLPPAEMRRFAQAQAIGYQQRRAWTLKEMAGNATAAELARDPQIVTLPPLGGEAETLLAKTDILMLTATSPDLAGMAWDALRAAFPPEIPIRHLRNDADFSCARQFLDINSARINPHIIVVADNPAAILARLFPGQPPAKSLKSGQPLTILTFRGATVASIAPHRAAETIARLALTWSGSSNE